MIEILHNSGRQDMRGNDMRDNYTFADESHAQKMRDQLGVSREQIAELVELAAVKRGKNG